MIFYAALVQSVDLMKINYCNYHIIWNSDEKLVDPFFAVTLYSYYSVGQINFGF
jgi:hypothetical protein